MEIKICQETLKTDEGLRMLRRNGYSQSEINKALQVLGETALREGSTFFAYRAYQELGDTEGLRKTAELGLTLKDDIYATLNALRLIKDDEGVRELIKWASKDEEGGVLERIIEQDMRKEIEERMTAFKAKYGFNKCVAFPKAITFNAAFNLIPNYEIGVGIARGGLYSTFVFSTLNLPIILAESHRQEKGTTFRWHDSPDGIEGKRVLVFDEDISSGRTSKRTLKEILKFRPTSVDLFLNYGEDVSNLSAVPQGYGKIYTPEMFNFEKFPELYDILQEKFKPK